MALVPKPGLGMMGQGSVDWYSASETFKKTQRGSHTADEFKDIATLGGPGIHEKEQRDFTTESSTDRQNHSTLDCQ